MQTGIQQSTFQAEGFDVSIMGRAALEQLAKEGFEPKTVVVSIVDTDAPLVQLSARPAALLRLSFDDVGDADHPISCHVMDDADTEDLEVIALFQPISAEQAEEAAKFLRANLPGANHLICQCEFGQSRSAAVAKAVLSAFGGNPEEIDTDSRYHANELVYGKLNEALNTA